MSIPKERAVMKATAEQIQAIWKSMREPVRGKRDVSPLIARIASEGWASLPDIEDVFYLTDVRIDNMRHAMSAVDLCRALEIPIQSVFRRPRSRQATVSGTQGVRVEDVAELLMELERLGYSVDPMPLVEAIIEPIRQKQRVTNSELSVLWYAANRHKMRALSVTLDGEWPRLARTERFKTATGYTVEAWLDEAGNPFRLEVRAPKFRSRPEPKRETCTVCGYEWYRGNPDSSAAHRREHKRRLYCLTPSPAAERRVLFNAGGSDVRN